MGAIVANSLFMLGASFLIGELKHHVQTYNRNNARLRAGMLFLATIALLIPSILAEPILRRQATIDSCYRILDKRNIIQSCV